MMSLLNRARVLTRRVSVVQPLLTFPVLVAPPLLDSTLPLHKRRAHTSAISPSPFSVTSSLDGCKLVGDLYTPATTVDIRERVLMLHGGGQTRHAWGLTAERLAAQGHAVVSLDLRGHGDSQWSPGGVYSTDVFHSDVLAALEGLLGSSSNSGGQAVVVGASLGGIIGLSCSDSLRTKELMRAIVLVDISPGMSPEGVGRILDFMSAYPDGFASLKDAAAAVAAFQPHRKQSSQNGSTEGLKKNLRLDKDGRYKWHWDARMLRNRYFQRENLHELKAALDENARRLKIPCLLLRGQMSDVVSPEAVEEFRRNVPHCSYVDVRDAAHMIAGDKNDIFTKAVQHFINNLPPKA